jgi:cytochrome c oxidase subunit 2
VLTVSATAAGVWARQVKGGGADEIKVLDVIASKFKFEPTTITVVEGDRVRLRLRSADRTHGIGIKAFRVKALIPKVGEDVTVDFVADRAGTFDIICSEYCGTGHQAMKGRLVVVARAK